MLSALNWDKCQLWALGGWCLCSSSSEVLLPMTRITNSFGGGGDFFCLAWACFKSLFRSRDCRAIKESLQRKSRPVVDGMVIFRILHFHHGPVHIFIKTKKKTKKTPQTPVHVHGHTPIVFFPPYGGWLTCQLYRQLSQLLWFERQRQMRLWKRTLCFLSFVAISPHLAAQKHTISIKSYRANYNIFILIT